MLIQELIPLVVTFIEDNLQKTLVTKSLIILLKNWKLISAILSIKYIKDE